MEAWLLRRLVTIFSQAAKRPHVPRDAQMRKLFSCIGINLESAPSEGPPIIYDRCCMSLLFDLHQSFCIYPMNLENPHIL